MAPVAFHMMAKPTSYRCNLKCEYCFYLEKSTLFSEGSKGSSSDVMPDGVLKRYVREYIAASGDQVDFAWQGGEPTLAGLSFYEKVVRYQQAYANGKTITNSFQTNAIAINRQWAQFFAKHGFLLGVSLDGLPEVHDKYRISVNGQPTFSRVKQAIELLQAHRVEFNTLTVINDQNWDKGKETYRFLKSLGVTHMQFIPIVEVQDSASCSSHHYAPKSQTLTGFSVPAHGYGQFMTDVFDEWLKDDVGQVFVRLFDSVLGTWLGLPASTCVQSETCGQAMVIEANGDVYSCDHYVYPANRLGNIASSTLSKMASSVTQRHFGQAKAKNLSNACRNCEVKALCHGGCPKHRIVSLPNEKQKQNYLCESYRRIFRHTAPAMHLMGQAIRRGGTAQDAIPQILQARY